MTNDYDDVYIAQHLLEGRCLDCGEIEPGHLPECPNNPDTIIATALAELVETVNKWRASRSHNRDGSSSV